MNVAIVSHDVQTVNGRGHGVARFTLHLLKLLRQHYPADRIKLIYATVCWDPQQVDPQWRNFYQDLDVEVIETYAPRPAVERSPYNVSEQILAEQVYPHLLDSDIIYFADWGHAGFHLLRNRRFHPGPHPICVTVMHGATEWVRQGRAQHMSEIEELNRLFIERYAFSHSDYVVSPGHYMLGWLQSREYALPPQPQQRILALPITDQVCHNQPQPMHAAQYKQLVFFNGRLERRKGIDLLMAALNILHKQKAFGALEEVILLASPDPEEPARSQQLQQQIQALGLNVQLISHYDSDQAQQFLRDNASDSLIVIPSLVDNFPYAVIEATLIPGLNVICSDVGSVSEILGEANRAHLFTPTPSALAACLVRQLQAGPQAGLHPYNGEHANQGWVNFHGELRAMVQNRPAMPRVQLSEPTVDVCIPYYNQGRFLPQLLEVLDRQTYQNLTAIVVDDGSTDPESVQVFKAMQQQYPQWHFIHQENQFVDAARNAAACAGNGDYLLFVDPDDVISLNAVERLVQAIQISGDDVLACNSCVFSSEALPYDLNTGQICCPIQQHLTPLGADLVGGVTHPVVFGSNVILIRRPVFEAIGGYTLWPGIIHEDWELFVRLSLAGYKVDVLPEFHHFYRKLGIGLSASLIRVDCERRLLQPYEEALASVGLRGLASYLLGLYKENEMLKLKLRQMERQQLLPQSSTGMVPIILKQNPIRVIAQLLKFTFFNQLIEHNLEPAHLTFKDWLRLAYRQLVPLQQRLQWHKTAMRLWSHFNRLHNR